MDNSNLKITTQVVSLWILYIPLTLLLVTALSKVNSETTQSPDSLADQEFMCSSIEACNAANSSMCMCSAFANGPNCECSPYFQGPRCNSIDLRVPVKSVLERGIQFRWETEVCLDDHVVIFTKTPARRRSTILIQEIAANWTEEIEVDGMAPDAQEYILCIITNSELTNVSENQMHMLFNRSLPNCGILITAFAEDGAFSLAFIGIAAAMGLVFVALLVAQTVERCRNRETRERILSDVRGGLNKFRSGSKKTVDSHDSVMEGHENGQFTGIANQTYTSDESFDEVDRT